MKILLTMFIALCLISIVSASPIQEFFQDNVTQLTITISQNESQAELYLNIEGTSFDKQNFDYNSIKVEGVYISSLLNDINGQIEVQEGSYYPQFRSLTIRQGGVAQFLIDNALDYLDYAFTTNDINNNLSLINDELVNNPLPISSDRDILLTKNGNDYKIWDNKGYGDISADYKKEIERIINKTMININIPELFTQLLPIANENGLDLSLLENVDMNYAIGLIDLDNLKLENGEYVIKVFVEREGINYTKDVKIILKDITPIVEVVVLTQSSGGGHSHKSADKTSENNIATPTESVSDDDKTTETNQPINLNPKPEEKTFTESVKEALRVVFIEIPIKIWNWIKGLFR